MARSAQLHAAEGVLVHQVEQDQVRTGVRGPQEGRPFAAAQRADQARFVVVGDVQHVRAQLGGQALHA